MTTTTAPVKPVETIRVFRTTQEARDYRHLIGCGGWIFAPDPDDKCDTVAWKGAILFSPNLAPSDIFNHPMTKGRSGSLFGNA